MIAAPVLRVWLVECRTRTLTWIAKDRTERVFSVGDVLDNGELIPGFRLAIADIFR